MGRTQHDEINHIWMERHDMKTDTPIQAGAYPIGTMRNTERKEVGTVCPYGT